jgi:sugar phosphate isomerase/epimerase
VPTLTQQTVLAHFSLRYANWPDRVSAAANSGFTGVGLYVGEYLRLQQAGWTDEAMQSVLDAYGMPVIELEAMRFFSDDFEPFDKAISTFGPQRLQVVPPFDGPCDRPAAAEWLRDVAQRYEQDGVQIAIEFLGCSEIDSAPVAVELIEMAGRPNIGLCVDSWHVMRGRGLDPLRGLDPAMVAAIQIDDGPLVPTLPDYIPDCLHYRCPLGEGEFPLREFLSLLPADAPLSVEVIDDDMDLLPTPVVADRLYQSLVATVAGA